MNQKVPNANQECLDSQDMFNQLHKIEEPKLTFDSRESWTAFGEATELTWQNYKDDNDPRAALAEKLTNQIWRSNPVFPLEIKLTSDVAPIAEEVLKLCCE